MGTLPWSFQSVLTAVSFLVWIGSSKISFLNQAYLLKICGKIIWQTEAKRCTTDRSKTDEDSTTSRWHSRIPHRLALFLFLALWFASLFFYPPSFLYARNLFQPPSHFLLTQFSALFTSAHLVVDCSLPRACADWLKDVCLERGNASRPCNNVKKPSKNFLKSNIAWLRFTFLKLQFQIDRVHTTCVLVETTDANFGKLTLQMREISDTAFDGRYWIACLTTQVWESCNDFGEIQKETVDLDDRAQYYITA